MLKITSSTLFKARVFLLLTLFLIHPCVLASEVPMEQTETYIKEAETLQQQVQTDLCPASEDSDYELICFVRKLKIKGQWAGIRWVQQYMEDSFFVYHKQEGKWVKIMAQAMPDWEEVKSSDLEIPESIYSDLAKALFPPEPES